VDREALAMALTPHISPEKAARSFTLTHEARLVAEALIASGLFVDRSEVEAVQREKDARLAEQHPLSSVPGEHRTNVAAAIRAGSVQ
jgi:hypothetical protein